MYIIPIHFNINNLMDIVKSFVYDQFELNKYRYTKQ